MKRYYSYFIIKPDGIRYIDDICSVIEEKHKSVKYYSINDFDKIIKKLYYKHYENKGEKFANSFDAYLYGLNELFGNESIMVLVSDNEKTYPELMQDVFDTKSQIRKTYVTDKIGIITDYGNIDESYIRFHTESGISQKPRIMSGIGKYRISDMNIIHCPNPNKEDTLTELKILIDEGIFDDKNLITNEMMSYIKRYKTASFQKDMREPDYIGAIQPDISGFIKGEIFKSFEDER